MKKFDQWYLPEHEMHLIEWMKNINRRVDGRLAYQYNKYEMALPYARGRGLAIDVGAHIGLWSFWMARDFKEVQAFEPVPEHIECWKMNMMATHGNAHLNTVALGAEIGEVRLGTRTDGSSGDTGIEENGQWAARMAPMDIYNFTNVGLIKIDCEGYELNVLKGAENTLKENRPCVIVEQKGNMSERYGIPQLAAVAYLESLGARTQAIISGDYILSWA